MLKGHTKGVFWWSYHFNEGDDRTPWINNKKNNYFSMISKEMDKIALQRDVEGIKIGKMVEMVDMVGKYREKKTKR